MPLHCWILRGLHLPTCHQRARKSKGTDGPLGWIPQEVLWRTLFIRHTSKGLCEGSRGSHLGRGFGGRSHCPTSTLTSVDHLNLPLALVPWFGYLLALGQDLSSASPEGWVSWSVREGRRESWCHHPSEESIRATKRQRCWLKADPTPSCPSLSKTEQEETCFTGCSLFFFKDSPLPLPRPPPLGW